MIGKKIKIRPILRSCGCSSSHGGVGTWLSGGLAGCHRVSGIQQICIAGSIQIIVTDHAAVAA